MPKEGEDCTAAQKRVGLSATLPIPYATIELAPINRQSAQAESNAGKRGRVPGGEKPTQGDDWCQS